MVLTLRRVSGLAKRILATIITVPLIDVLFIIKIQLWPSYCVILSPAFITTSTVAVI